MDGAHFDHLSRLITRPATRRAALALVAALGLSAHQPADGKKRRNPCRGGCGPCRVCRRTGRKKRCVTAPEGTPCAGGTCRAGTCCVPDTCASVGVTCGPISDGCGAPLACGTCGTGATASCNGGTCATCPDTCGVGCFLCYHRLDGSTVCGNPVSGDCTLACATDADCPPSFPLCAAASTVRATNVTTTSSVACAVFATAVCVSYNPC